MIQGDVSIGCVPTFCASNRLPARSLSFAQAVQLVMFQLVFSSIVVVLYTNIHQKTFFSRQWE